MSWFVNLIELMKKTVFSTHGVSGVNNFKYVCSGPVVWSVWVHGSLWLL